MLYRCHQGGGLDLMRTMRAKGINLPGIALSGYGREKDMQASREAGFVVHLVKPVNLLKLKETIASIGEGIPTAKKQKSD